MQHAGRGRTTTAAFRGLTGLNINKALTARHFFVTDKDDKNVQKRFNHDIIEYK